MQAITTEYKAENEALNKENEEPTNTRGSRIIVRAEAGRITVPWDYALDIEGNHREAVKAFVKRFGWEGSWVLGSSPGGRGYTAVCIKRDHPHVFRTPHPQAVDPSVLLVVREGDLTVGVKGGDL